MDSPNPAYLPNGTHNTCPSRYTEPHRARLSRGTLKSVKSPLPRAGQSSCAVRMAGLRVGGAVTRLSESLKPPAQPMQVTQRVSETTSQGPTTVPRFALVLTHFNFLCFKNYRMKCILCSTVPAVRAMVNTKPEKTN